MKRILSVILCFCVIVSSVVFTGTNASAASEYTSGYYTYTVSDGEVTITDCDKSISGDITIPSKIGGYTVTSIDWFAFADCESLTNVTIGNSVTDIGYGAFAGCTSLTSISVSSSNNKYCSIDGVLFNKNKTELIQYPANKSDKSYIIPDSVTEIDGHAFYNCTSLTSVTIPDSIIIWYGAFENCISLINIMLGDNIRIDNCAFENTGYYNDESNWYNDVLYIGKYLITGTAYLDSYSTVQGDYKIKKGTEFIAYYAFADCTSLTSLTIPDSVTNIGDLAFLDCTSLASVTIPNSVTYIGLRAFDGCKSLTNLTIPSSVTTIDDFAFDSCTSLKNVTILNGLTEIYCGTFYNCTSLESIAIPTSVTGINNEAFYGCTSLSDVYYAGSEDEWNKIRINSGNECLTNATIHYNYTPSEIQFGSDRFNFNKDITGYVGEQLNSLLVYTSAEHNITSLDIKSSNTDIVEVGSIQIGSDRYIPDTNDHLAEVPLILKSEGTAAITITSPDGVRESINVNVTKIPKSIAVFSTEKSFSVKINESMWLAFGLMNDNTGEVESEWKKMAVVVSDPTIISLSDYKETEYGYSLEVIGKKEGSTNVTITDTESGISTSIVVSVFDSYTKSYSYSIKSIEEFYPNNDFEKDIKTNIYDLNGLYINNYTCISAFDGSEFQVSFDVYNSKYYNGAVDVYDADGVWIDCEYIDRYSDITSLRDTGEQLFFLIYDTANKQLLSYQSSSFSKKTSINITVPKGGYFTISNNMAESPGAFFANALEILYDTTSDLIDFATSKSSDKTAFDKFYKEATKSFAQNVIDARNESLSGEAKKKVMEVALNSLTSEIKKIQKKFVTAEAKDFVMNGNEMFSAISTLAENILNSYSINWKHLYQGVTGVAESMFIKFSGPAGVALQGMFAITKTSNKLLMATQMARSLDNTYATIYSSIDEGYINSHGVIVNTSGSIDSEAALQVFKVSDNDTLEVVLNADNPLEKYELYNICFVKDDKLVQPNGKVKVYVPIPNGMNGDTCKIYRQETDGSWTILDAQVEGNYLAFETEHFSLYAVIGNMQKLNIHSVPNKVIYNEGDVLNTEGLVIELNGQLISEGFICEPTVLSECGSQKITVKYGCATTEFNVSVEKSTDITPGDPTTPTQPVEPINYGDCDNNGKINIRDLLFLRKHLAEVSVDIDLVSADCNADGQIDIKDVLLLEKYLLKYTDSLGKQE